MSRFDTPAQPDATAAPFRIGIVGGMGPMAGVYLQQLIIEATPASRDQDHLEVVCFTNPHVPERMRSLAEDGGRRYAEAVTASAVLVERAGASCIAIPCNTAHARLPQIQAGVGVPIVNMIEVGLETLVAEHGTSRPVGLLATVGTLNERVYEDAPAGRGLTWLRPDADDQAQVADVILAIKVGRAGEVQERFRDVARRLVERGAGLILVGCTELSMIAAALGPLGVPIIDPLRLLAARLVALGLRHGG